MNVLTEHLQHKVGCSGEELETIFYAPLRKEMIRCKNCLRMVVAMDADINKKFG